MDMESYAYVKHLKELVEQGKVKIQVIDEAVRRILKVKFELGLFDNPFLYCDSVREKELTNSKAFHEAALDVAKKSIVLLKNEHNILPLKKSQQKLAIIGVLAEEKNSPLGSWRLGADDSSAVSVLEGFSKYTSNFTYAKGAALSLNATNFVDEVVINETDKSGFANAIQTAKNAEVVVMVLGEHGFQSGEGRSRTNLNLPGVQQELLEEIYKVNKNIVLVVMNGRPLTLNWADVHVPAIVEAWQLGSESGNAIAQVLFGDYNPSGKLPMSFPKSVGQLPLYYNYFNTGRPGPKKEVFWSHYTDESNEPLYPFGYGLSYTKFDYSNLIIDKRNPKAIKVTITIRNYGAVAGEEIAQLYIHDKVASIVRPVKELKGFSKIMLKAGESKTVTFVLTEKELGFYNENGTFIFEPGEFNIMVGASSRDIKLQQVVDL